MYQFEATIQEEILDDDLVFVFIGDNKTEEFASLKDAMDWLYKTYIECGWSVDVHYIPLGNDSEETVSDNLKQSGYEWNVNDVGEYEHEAVMCHVISVIILLL